MIPFLWHFIRWIIGFFGSRQDLILDNLALRQQLLALHTNKRPRRRLSAMQKLFWVLLRPPVGMAEASDPGNVENGGGVASSRISLVLEMALQSSTTWGANLWPRKFGC